eukprot:10853703-Lingulodinium_polyedra.AAC.1
MPRSPRARACTGRLSQRSEPSWLRTWSVSVVRYRGPLAPGRRRHRRTRSAHELVLRGVRA